MRGWNDKGGGKWRGASCYCLLCSVFLRTCTKGRRSRIWPPPFWSFWCFFFFFFLVFLGCGATQLVSSLGSLPKVARFESGPRLFGHFGVSFSSFFWYFWVAGWSSGQLVGLITRRSPVRIWPPQPMFLFLEQRSDRLGSLPKVARFESGPRNQKVNFFEPCQPPKQR